MGHLRARGTMRQHIVYALSCQTYFSQTKCVNKKDKKGGDLLNRERTHGGNASELRIIRKS